MIGSELMRTSLCAAALAIPAVASAQMVNLPRIAERDFGRELSCAADSPLIEPIMTKRIVAGSERGRTLFATGDAVIVNAGTAQGLQAGQQFYIRRVVSDRFSEPLPGFVPISVHTAGWLRIVDAQEDVSFATITQACDGAMVGDYLEEFVPATVSSDLPEGEPDYSQPAHLILGDERRQMGAAGSLMVMDRGSDHDLKAGQRVTLFQYTLGGAGPVVRVGTGTIAVLRKETSLVRIDTANQAVFVGDLVAIHR
jgi:hypothetical protein